MRLYILTSSGNFFVLLVDSAIGIVNGSLSVEGLDEKGSFGQCSGHSFCDNDFKLSNIIILN